MSTSNRWPWRSDQGYARKFLAGLTAVALAFSMSALPAIALEPPAPVDPATTAAPTISTDKAEYFKGTTVTLTGSGWIGATETTDAESVSIVVAETGGNWDKAFTVTPETSGQFTAYFDLPTVLYPEYMVTATGSVPWIGGSLRSATTSFIDPEGAANIDQCRNGEATSPVNCLDNGGNDGWVNGNVGASQAHMMEGYSTPFRTVMSGLPVGIDITLLIGYDIKNSGANAYDFLTSYQRLDPHTYFGHPAETVDPADGVDMGTWAGTPDEFPIPVPNSTTSALGTLQPSTRFNSLPAAEKVMTLWGGDITDIQYFTQGDLAAAQSETQVAVTFTTDNPTLILAWGGHIARCLDWGLNAKGECLSAGGISGSPYHMRLKDWTSPDTKLTNLGNQDRSMAADVVVQPGNLTIAKAPLTTGPDAYVGPFTFAWTCTDGTTGSANINAGESHTVIGLPEGTSCTVTETIPDPPPGFDFGTPVYDPGQTVVIVGGATVTVTTTNTLERLSWSLTVDKTASATYDRTVEWDLTKTVEPDTHTGFAGQTAGSSTWTVVADKTETLGNYVVSGQIVVSNPAPVDVVVDVADVLDDGTVAAVDCDPAKEGDQPTGTVPKATGGTNGTLTCTYEALPGDDDAGSNLVTVTTDSPFIEGDATHLEMFDWNENLIGADSVTLADERFDDYSQPISADKTEYFAETFTCPAATEVDYIDGHYQFKPVNTATLTGGSTNLSRSALVTVDCYLPSAAKTAVGSYDLRWTWDVKKSVSPLTQSGFAGDNLPWTWTVTVDETSAKEDFEVSGDIVITNPAPIPMTVSEITDTLSGEGLDPVTAVVTCPKALPFVVASGSPVTCTYLADDVGGDGYTLNTVEVVTDKGTFSDSEPVVWNADPTTVYNGTATLVDPDAGLNALLTAGDSGQRTFTSVSSHTCSSDTEQYGDDYSYNGSVTNTATVTGSSGHTGTASSTTAYSCYIPEVSKTAAGAYGERHEWDVEKSVSPAFQDAFAGATVSYTWTVEVTEEVFEEGFVASGTITVVNPNPEDAMTVALSDVLSDGTVPTITGCTGDEDVSDGWLTVAAGGSSVCDYTAALTYDDVTEAPTGNTATVTLNGIAFPAFDPIEWVKSETRPDATVVDDQIGLDVTVVDGETFYGYEEYTCSADVSYYAGDGTYRFSEDNTAIVSSGDVEEDRDSATETIDCFAPVVSKTAAGTYDERHEWDVEKTVDPASQSGFAGDTVEFDWTITVTESVFEENFDVTGAITVVNPAPMAMTVSLADVLSDSTAVVIGACSNGATYAAGSLTIPANTTTVCGYTANDLAYTDDAAAPTNNTATATLNDIQFTAADSIEWAVNVIRGEVQLTDLQGPLSKTISGSGTWTIEDTYTCSTDETKYTSEWSYTDTVLNTAIVSSEEQEQDRSTATTTIDCYVPEVSKIAAGAYDERHEWDVEKTVDPASQSGFAGDTVPFSWTVEVTEDVFEENFVASGTITVVNHNPEDDMTVALSDVLSDGKGATISACTGDGDLTDGLTVVAGGTSVCTYTAAVSYDDDAKAPTGNTATVTLNDVDYIATDAIEWTANVIRGSATVTDDQMPLDEVIENGEGWTYGDSYTCSTDLGDYGEEGTYQDSVTNTAIVTSGGAEEDRDTATETINCYLWDVSKTANGTYQDEYGWDITKTVNPASQTGKPGDTLSWTWSITWNSFFEQEINHAVTGVITVDNPADLELTVAVADELTGGFAASVVCNDTDKGTSLTIPANGSGTCSYSASPASQLAQNTATATRNSVSVSDTVKVSWVKGADVGLDAVISDSNHADIPADSEQPYTYTGSATCSTAADDYGVTGTYSGGASNTATITWTAGSDSSTASTTYDCNASFVQIEKRTNGGVDPTLDIRFRLYDDTGKDLNDEVSTLNDLDGLLQFATALRPGDSYTVCEFPVPAAYTFEIKDGDGNFVSTYAGPPGTSNPTGEVQCFDFVAAASPDTLTFYVNNRYPGGAPRTPGYWKNWSTCTGGGQAETAAKLNAEGMEVFILDDLLPRLVGLLNVTDCKTGVYVLSTQWAVGKSAGKQASSDAAYELARNYLAADLNIQAGACTAPGTWKTRLGEARTFTQVMADAQAFLIQIGYDGDGELLTSRTKKVADRTYALYLAGILDDYNNGEFCTGTPSH